MGGGKAVWFGEKSVLMCSFVCALIDELRTAFEDDCRGKLKGVRMTCEIITRLCVVCQWLMSVEWCKLIRARANREVQEH